jgi:hypothetical protein
MKLTYHLPIVEVEGQEPGKPEVETLEGDFYPIVNTLNMIAEKLVARGFGVPVIESVEPTPEESIAMMLISLEYGRAVGGFIRCDEDGVEIEEDEE